MGIRKTLERAIMPGKSNTNAQTNRQKQLERRAHRRAHHHQGLLASLCVTTSEVFYRVRVQNNTKPIIKIHHKIGISTPQPHTASRV